MNVLRLFRRPKPALCNAADGFVLPLTRARADDLPCPEPLQPVPAHCATCGQITVHICSNPKHNPGSCPACTAAGDLQPVTFIPAGTP